MNIEDITPHLNKFATIYLYGNKRKTGLLFLNTTRRPENHSTAKVKEVIFIKAKKAKKIVYSPGFQDKDEFKIVSESISINHIQRIRSVK